MVATYVLHAAVWLSGLVFLTSAWHCLIATVAMATDGLNAHDLVVFCFVLFGGALKSLLQKTFMVLYLILFLFLRDFG